MDGAGVGVEDQVEEVEDLIGRLQALVQRRVLPEDPQQLVLLGQQLGDAELVLRPADEVLLAGLAHDVGVQVAEADERERAADGLVVAAQLLIARLDVDARVVVGARRRRVVVAAVHVGVDAPDRVHEVREAGEVGVDDVVDAQVGEHVGLDRLDQQPVAALAVGGVDLGDAVAGNVDLQVAGDRHHVDRGGLRVEADQQHRVRVGVPERFAGPMVGADDEERSGGRPRRAGRSACSRSRGSPRGFGRRP